MRLTHLLSHEIVISRLSDLGSNKMAFTTVTSCRGELQPIGDENSSLDEGVYGKKFVLYTDGNVSLYAGDRLRDDNNNYYTVKSAGVTARQHGRISFSKIVIELTN